MIVEGCGWKNVFGGTDYLFADSGAGWIRALPLTSDRAGSVVDGSGRLRQWLGAGLVPDGPRPVVVRRLQQRRNRPTVHTGRPHRDRLRHADGVPAASGPWRALLGALLGLVGLGLFWRRPWSAAGLIGAASLAGVGCGRPAAAPSRARPDEAFRAYRDPNTGRLGEPPAGTVTAAPASAAAAAAPLGEEAAPGGGRMIRLQGAFHSQFVAAVDAHGVHASCDGTDAARGR